MKVAVLMGGRSSEREISLRTGRGMAQALRNLGHDVVAIDTATGRALPAGEEERAAPSAEALTHLPAKSEVAVANSAALAEAEVVLIALHGGEGEDGTIQALLELAGRPYTGSGVTASAVAMNKAMSKRIFEHAGIPTPRWVLLEDGRMPEALDLDALGGVPIVVKPNLEGSSVGLTIVDDPGDLPEAIAFAARYGTEVLVEEFIPGRELTVAVLGDEALPVVEIRPKSGLYDYESKYTSGKSEYFCPADLPEPLAARVRDLSLRAHQVLGCRGVTRVDFRLDDLGTPFCLEVNTVPGMTPLSLVPMAAKAAGMTYDQVVQRMIDLALAEWRRRRGRISTPGASARV